MSADGPFIGQFGLFAGGTPPPGWLPCDGQILPVEGNEALAALLGSGPTQFALPDLRSRTLCGLGADAFFGVNGGRESVSLATSEIPAHTHLVGVNSGSTGSIPTGSVLAGGTSSYIVPPGNASLDRTSITATGGGIDGIAVAHSNIQPYLAINICICVVGGQVPTNGTPTGGGSFGFFGGVIIFTAFPSILPAGWAICDGTEVSRTTFAGLFSLIGTTFGAGDGVTTFNLPDLRNRAVNGAGTGLGLSAYAIGDVNGEERHPLTISELPVHTHTMMATTATATLDDPTLAMLASASTYNSVTSGAHLDTSALAMSGLAAKHENRQPFYLSMPIIALDDVDPAYALGEIRIMPASGVPPKWAACDGSLYATAAFPDAAAAIGTIYGSGPGSFAVPDLRGRIPVHCGAGNGLTNYPIASTGGTETVVLATNQIPSHTHAFTAGAGRRVTGQVATPAGHVLSLGDTIFGPVPITPVAMGAAAVESEGAGAGHNNLMPMVAMGYMVALQL